MEATTMLGLLGYEKPDNDQGNPRQRNQHGAGPGHTRPDSSARACTIGGYRTDREMRLPVRAGQTVHDRVLTPSNEDTDTHRIR